MIVTAHYWVVSIDLQCTDVLAQFETTMAKVTTSCVHFGKEIQRFDRRIYNRGNYSLM